MTRSHTKEIQANLTTNSFHSKNPGNELIQEFSAALSSNAIHNVSKKDTTDHFNPANTNSQKFDVARKMHDAQQNSSRVHAHAKNKMLAMQDHKSSEGIDSIKETYKHAKQPMRTPKQKHDAVTEVDLLDSNVDNQREQKVDNSLTSQNVPMEEQALDHPLEEPQDDLNISEQQDELNTISEQQMQMLMQLQQALNQDVHVIHEVSANTSELYVEQQITDYVPSPFNSQEGYNHLDKLTVETNIEPQIVVSGIVDAPTNSAANTKDQSSVDFDAQQKQDAMGSVATGEEFPSALHIREAQELPQHQIADLTVHSSVIQKDLLNPQSDKTKYDLRSELSNSTSELSAVAGTKITVQGDSSDTFNSQEFHDSSGQELQNAQEAESMQETINAPIMETFGKAMANSDIHASVQSVSDVPDVFVTNLSGVLGSSLWQRADGAMVVKIGEPSQKYSFVADQVIEAMNICRVMTPRRITIEMNPSCLGEISISLQYSTDGKINKIDFSCASSDTMWILQQDTRELKHAITQIAQDAEINFSQSESDVLGQQNQGAEDNKRSFYEENNAHASYLEEGRDREVQDEVYS